MEKRKVDLLFLGDSLVNRADLSSMFQGYETVNGGKDGDTTGMLYNRLTDYEHLSPRLVFILVGMNNLLSARKEYEPLYNRVKGLFPKSKVYFLSITPTGGIEYMLNEEIEGVNDYLKRLVQRLGIGYIDIHSCLREFGGGIKREYTFDGIHLTHKAYEEVKKVLLPYLEKEAE